MESESWRGWYRYFIFYWAFFLYLYAVWGEGVMSKRRKKRRVCNIIYLYSTRKGEGEGEGGFFPSVICRVVVLGR